MAKGGRIVTGKVKWWAPAKGYGFVIADDGPNGAPMTEVFVHYKDIVGDGRKDLNEGQRIEFNVRHTPKGPRATDVKMVSA
jgi:CspA family cold shock protein